jgi:hypothetical protein
VKGRQTIGEKRQIWMNIEAAEDLSKSCKEPEKLRMLAYPRNAQRLLAVATDRREPLNNDAIEPPSELHRHAKIDRR